MPKQINTIYALNTNDILCVTMYLTPSLNTLIIVVNLLDMLMLEIVLVLETFEK